MKINAITIEREYGSGGTKIAKRLSKQADIPCYGSVSVLMVLFK